MEAVFSVKIKAVYSWLNSYRDRGFIGFTRKKDKDGSIFSGLYPEEQKYILDKIDQGDSVKATTYFIHENISEHVSERMLKSYLKGYVWKRIRCYSILFKTTKIPF